ncbi:hypothetical protein N9933_03410, partial [bacterium]|nr:hypothetical protein [bacterium]
PYQSKALEILETFPEGKLFLVNTTFDNVYHVGHSGFNFSRYFQVAKTDLVSIRSSEDERQLFLKYNIPMPNKVIVRLYDEQGTLQYIEKLSDVGKGVEKKVNLIHLQAGGYNLEVKLDSGRTLNQRIEIHQKGS